MRKQSYYIVNGITLYRLVVFPLLILLIIYKRFDLYKWLLLVSFLTDAIDGFLARRYKVVSVLGAKLDSVADDLTILSVVIGAIVYKPEFIRKEMSLIIILLGLFVFQTIYAFVQYGKLSSFHTYAAKFAAILQGSFLLLLFFLREPVYWLFYIAAVVTIADLLEEIILVWILPEWTANVKGIFWIMRDKRLNKG
ncbi:MAG: CDP-alcohol phosphatidyltransferase family protein [Bacteroidota bacterium]|nr:CDP-alcohol phosphatidyltransferase family protein [Bacteroidota bacterium]